MPFSPKQQFAGQTVLLTGGLGYLGSIVLEQLLRLTEAKKVYLLVRGKRQQSAAKRVEDLLRGPLFHLLHQDAISGKRNVFSRVQALEGDLTEPMLGLSAEDADLVKQKVGIVLHCGANIELDADVQMTLRNNYMGTMQLLHMASNFEQLHSFVHVSTYFVNNHLPRNSVVKEQIYLMPLSVDGVAMSHVEYVEAMLAMEPEQANKQTAELMAQLSFTSTYAFGKHLTEQLVDSTVIKPGVSKAIVRPSLIASIAKDPYPGFINSYAGAGGYTMGYALGFFQGLRSVAYGSDTFLDLIPADTVASLVIAAGAAAAATFGSPSADRAAVIFHAASAECYPLSISRCFDRMARFWTANPPPLCLPVTKYLKIKEEHMPTQAGIDAGAKTAKFKIKLVGALLKVAGKQREYRALKMGFKAFSVHNSLAYGKSFKCSVDNGKALRAQMLPGEREQWPIVWDESVMEWDSYGYTFMAGVRRLLFRMDSQIKKFSHDFQYKSAVKPEQLALDVSGSSSNTGSNSNTCVCTSSMTSSTSGRNSEGYQDEDSIEMSAAAEVVSLVQAAFVAAAANTDDHSLVEPLVQPKALPEASLIAA